jgi:hypothetical protein
MKFYSFFKSSSRASGTRQVTATTETQSECEGDDVPKSFFNMPSNKFPNVVDFFALIGVFCVIQLIVRIGCIMVGIGSVQDGLSAEDAVVAKQDAGTQLNFYVYPIAMMAMIGATLVYRRARQGSHSLGHYSWSGLNPVLVLWGIVLMTATSIVIEPLTSLLPGPPDFYGRGGKIVLSTVLFAPLFEEFLCRAILLEAARAKGGVTYGIIFSSLFFGAMHFYPASVVSATLMGLILGTVYVCSNSLYLTILLHAFNNALALLLLTMDLGNTTLCELLTKCGWSSLYIPIYVISVVIFLVSGYKMWTTISRLHDSDTQ